MWNARSVLSSPRYTVSQVRVYLAWTLEAPREKVTARGQVMTARTLQSQKRARHVAFVYAFKPTSPRVHAGSSAEIEIDGEAHNAPRCYNDGPFVGRADETVFLLHSRRTAEDD